MGDELVFTIRGSFGNLVILGLCFTAPTAIAESQPERVRDHYDPAKVTRSISCSATGTWCDPQAAVYVTGSVVSTIELVDLPPALWKIEVDAGPGHIFGGGEPLSRAKIEFDETRDRVLVDIYRNRRVFPAYSNRPFHGLKAFSELRDAERSRPAILVTRTQNSSVAITIYWKEKIEDSSDSKYCRKPARNEKTVNCSQTLPPVDLIYQTWWIDLGGFYAFFKLTDQEVVSQALPVGSEQNQQPQVEVLRVSSGRERGTATGVMSTFFPANYPWLGLSFGLTENSGRSLSYFFGASLRLTGRGNRSVATVTAGGSWIPVKRFPNLSRSALGIPEGDPLILPAESPLLDGEVRYRDALFVAVTLGFALEKRSASGSKGG